MTAELRSMTLALSLSVGFSFALGLAAQDPPKPEAKPAAKEDPAKEKPSLFKRKRASKDDEKKAAEDKKKSEEDDNPLQSEGGAKPPTAPTKKADDKPMGKLEGTEEELAKGLKRNLGVDDGDPLQRAGERMRQVEEALAKLKADEETAELQTKIVADLRELLKRANQKNQKQKQNQKQDQDEDQKQKQGNGKQQQGGQQKGGQQTGKENRDKAGSARVTAAELAKMKEQRDVWGHLPDTERKLLNQSFKEEKLPEFRTAIEKYYSKIAEQANAKEK